MHLSVPWGSDYIAIPKVQKVQQQDIGNEPRSDEMEDIDLNVPWGSVYTAIPKVKQQDVLPDDFRKMYYRGNDGHHLLKNNKQQKLSVENMYKAIITCCRNTRNKRITNYILQNFNLVYIFLILST